MKHLILIITMALLIGCEPNPIIIESEPIITQTDLLTAHVWNFDTLTTTSNDPEFILNTSISSGYLKGSICKFYTNGLYTAFLSHTESYGTWSFNTSETEIIFDFGGNHFYNAPFTLTTTIFEFKDIVYPGSRQEFDMVWRWIK